jgi:hypothetical protein
LDWPGGLSNGHVSHESTTPPHHFLSLLEVSQERKPPVYHGDKYGNRQYTEVYMSYIDGICDAPFDTAESQDEAAAAHQMALDILYRIGCEFNIPNDKMKQLCRIALIDFNELQNHQGATA